MLGHLRKQLLRLPVIKKSVEDYRWRQEKERNRERFTHLMHVSNAVHTESKNRNRKGENDSKGKDDETPSKGNRSYQVS